VDWTAGPIKGNNTMTTLQEAAMKKALDFAETLWRNTRLDADTDEQLGVVMKYLRTALAQPVEPPFQPDWVNYRQGVEDGRAEALAQPVSEPEVLAHDNCRAEHICRSWCGNSACVSHTAAQELQAQPMCDKHPRYSTYPLCPDCELEKEAQRRAQPVAQPLTDAQVHAAIAALMSASNGDLEPTFDEMKAALMAAEKARGE
jgi:hypothetical protein